MTDLRWYGREEVEEAATALRRTLAGETWAPPEFWLAQDGFRLRDKLRVYYYLDVRAGRWYHWANEAWQPVRSVPERLEGPLALGSETILAGAGLPDDLVEDDMAEGPVTERLAASIRELGAVYRAGRLTARDTEEALAERHVVDREGRFWTVGVRSGRWYHSDGAGWDEANSPPSEGSLARFEVPASCEACGHALGKDGACPQCGAESGPVLVGASDEAYGAILAFLITNAQALPEPVAEPWDPPAGFPGAQSMAQTRCEACEAVNAPGTRFCHNCGAPLPCPLCGASPTPMEPTVPAPAPRLAHCPACGAALGEGRFCTRCGARVL